VIIRILSNGKSFKGAAAYLTHDPDADTTKRVEWTHTLNLANEDVPSAVNEMVWTARDAELLKQEAGVRAGGRATETPVKHLSLNWAPEDKPTPQHMIETSQDFLRHMGWHEHQAIIVAHNDKSFAHAHVLLNCVHPETGLKLDDGFEQRRAQAWALAYEREQGRIHCEQRLLHPEQREKAAPRNIWTAFQENEKEFARAEKSLQENGEKSGDAEKNRKNAEWKILKQFQRDERTDFFGAGKSEFSELRSSIYREVREEFRERWADYYEARKSGADSGSLTARKADLVAEQKSVLDARRDEACKELRESRDDRYRELLDRQKEARSELRDRQEAGLDNSLFLQQAQESHQRPDVNAEFRQLAEETTASNEAGPGQRRETAVCVPRGAEDATMHPGPSAEDDVGPRVGVSVGSLLDSLFFDLTTLGSAPPSRGVPRDPAGRDPFAASAEETVKYQREAERQKVDEDWRRERRPYGE
jgi:Relaxase/Mobilisation nuclease domain